MITIVNIAITYLIGLAPAIIIRYAILRRKPARTKTRYALTLAGYYIGIGILFEAISFAITNQPTKPSIHPMIATFIGCYIIFS